MTETDTAFYPNEPARSDDAERNAVTEAARMIGKLGGRPKGTYTPLTRWLRPQMARFKKQGCSCRNVFYSLAVEEDDGCPDFFIVSDYTADAYYADVFGDIRGKCVTWEAFRKLWQRA